MDKQMEKQLIENFLSKLYGDNSSKHTITNYKIDLEFYLNYLQSKNLSITEVTLEHLEGYKAYLRDATYGNGKLYSENTRARHISSLKSFYNYLHRRKVIIENPSEWLEVPKIEQGKEPIFMTRDEAQKLIDATNGELHALRDRTMITLFLTTGMRLSELVNLNVSDITGTQIKIRQGKGNKSRPVNISQDVADLIQQYLDSRKYDCGDAVFASQKGNRIGEKGVQQTIEKYIKKAGLDNDLSTHSLRHCFASTLVRNKVDLNTVRELMGHSSLRTTQIYTHVLDETKQEAANIIGNLFI